MLESGQFKVRTDGHNASLHFSVGGDASTVTEVLMRAMRSWQPGFPQCNRSTSFPQAQQEDITSFNVHGTDHGNEKLQPSAELFRNARIEILQFHETVQQDAWSEERVVDVEARSVILRVVKSGERIARSTTCAERVRSVSSSTHCRRSAVTRKRCHTPRILQASWQRFPPPSHRHV